MKYRFPRFPGGKAKAVTLSYDDGSNDDVKLLDIIDKYGIKCTFNLMGNSVGEGRRLSREYVYERLLDKGHEVATHGYNHRALGIISSVDGIQDTLNCRLALEKELDMIIRGLAFPDKAVDRFKHPDTYKQIRSYLEALGIVYARTLGGDNDSFELPEDWLNWMPTAHHANPNLMKYIDKFVNMDVENLYCAARSPRLFYLWGHSFEFERKGNWDLLENICSQLANRDDIWYATNIEIYDYIHAYNSLVFSADGSIAYNPTLIDVHFVTDGVPYLIHSGETLRFN